MIQIRVRMEKDLSLGSYTTNVSDKSDFWLSANICANRNVH